MPLMYDVGKATEEKEEFHILLGKVLKGVGETEKLIGFEIVP